MTIGNVLLALNLLVSLASACWAMVALTGPASMSGSVEVLAGEVFYARMYAARAIPFELMAGLLPIWSGNLISTWLVLAAALIQFLDACIGVANHNRGMIAGASVGTIVHLLCGLALLAR